MSTYSTFIHSKFEALRKTGIRVFVVFGQWAGKLQPIEMFVNGRMHPEKVVKYVGTLESGTDPHRKVAKGRCIVKFEKSGNKVAVNYKNLEIVNMA